MIINLEFKLKRNKKVKVSIKKKHNFPNANSSEDEFKVFEPRLKFKPGFKYG